MRYQSRLEVILNSLGPGYLIYLTQQVNDEKSQLCDFLVSLHGDTPIFIPDVEIKL